MTVTRRQVDLNLRTGEVALELLAWSKALSTSDPSSPDVLEIDRLVADGAGCFRRLLATLHGERETYSPEESDRWLAESRSRWHDREDMIDKGSFMRRPKLRLIEADFKRLDRTRPERSYSEVRPTVPAQEDGAGIADQLERLGVMRRDGILTEEEFRAAKARVIGQE